MDLRNQFYHKKNSIVILAHFWPCFGIFIESPLTKIIQEQIKLLVLNS